MSDAPRQVPPLEPPNLADAIAVLTASLPDEHKERAAQAVFNAVRETHWALEVPIPQWLNARFNPYSEREGFVAGLRSGATGDWVTIYLAVTQRLPADPPYLLLCQAHGYRTLCRTLESARWYMRHPEFCEECERVLIEEGRDAESLKEKEREKRERRGR